MTNLSLQERKKSIVMWYLIFTGRHSWFIEKTDVKKNFICKSKSRYLDYDLSFQHSVELHCQTQSHFFISKWILALYFYWTKHLNYFEKKCMLLKHGILFSIGFMATIHNKLKKVALLKKFWCRIFRLIFEENLKILTINLEYFYLCYILRILHCAI